MFRRSTARLLLLSALFAACVAAPAGAEEPFGLDDLPRTVEADGPIRCPKVDLVTYRGDIVRFTSPVRVFPEFRVRLQRFEAVVRDVATEFYGRAPKRIRHLGTFNCRRIRAWPTYLSEHGLGNAVDVAGFDFGPLSRKAARSSTLPPAMRRSFTVRMDPDWTASGARATHARFLHVLAERLIARKDIFRVMLGPAYPGHKNHFHFDCAPWRIVEIFPPEAADARATD